MDRSERKHGIRPLSPDGGGRDKLKRSRLEEGRQRDGRRRSRGLESEGDESESERKRRRERDGQQRHHSRGQEPGGEDERGGEKLKDREGRLRESEQKIEEKLDGKQEGRRERKSGWDIPPAPVANPQPVAVPDTQYLMLHNMFDTSAKDEEFYFCIEDVVHTKCAKEGSVLHSIHIDRKAGSLCLECDSIRSALVAKKIFDGCPLDGNIVTCTFLDEKGYKRRFSR